MRPGIDIQLMTAALISFLAFILDWILGDPQRWPHPVRWIGRLIEQGETVARCRAGENPALMRLAGAALALGVVFLTMAGVWLVLRLAYAVWSPLWFLAALYLVYAALCLRDLYHHSRRVAKALERGYLDEARHRLSWIVGRYTSQLDDAAIRRATIETLAENFSDGLVAPMLYLALGGPVLAWGYKAVNTLDSMIGYKNDKYLNLGRFSAKLDDAANYIPARLAALLIILSARLQGFNWRLAAKRRQRDGRLHTSPNSGQPEAAMAGALNIWLGGPSYYGGVLFPKPRINESGLEAGPAAIRAAEQIVIGAAILMLALLILTLLIFTGSWGWL